MTNTVGYGAVRSNSARVSPALSGLYLITVGLFLARAGLNSLVLNLFINYGNDGGSLVEKLHPSFYGLLAVAIIVLATSRMELDRWETSVVRRFLLLLACAAGMLVFAGLNATGGSAGFIVDSYVTACFAALLFVFPQSLRAGAGKALLVFFMISAVVALAEFVLKVRLLPFTESETAFRPTGLSSHPLDLGLWCAVCIPLTAATDWSRPIKIVVCGLFFAALAASGARTAMICGGISVLILAIGAIRQNSVPQRRLERRLIVAVAALLAVPTTLAVLSAAGALQRFQAGIGDTNAQARVTIYQVFDRMSWCDVLFGPGMPRVTAIAFKTLHLVAVESPLVIFIAIFGLIWTVIFIPVFAYVLAGLLRGASGAVMLAALLCFVIGLSSNGFATKEAPVINLFVFVIAFRRPRDIGRSDDQEAS